MTKKVTAFEKYFDIQEQWIRGQIEHFKYDSFIDLHLAQKEIEEAGITAFATSSDISNFRDKHLSGVGKKKLSSSLRTFKKRQNRKITTRRLDINISRSAYIALEALLREQGITKIQLIERLLLEEKARSDEECDSVIRNI